MAVAPGIMASSPGFFLDSFTGVKGAYSLRRLSGSIINVVRVRRDSDDTEADFSAAEIESGELADWVGAGNDGLVVKVYDQSGNDNLITMHPRQLRVINAPLWTLAHW
jgi:hypothetical protein